MASFSRRNRSVIFRLTEQEYECLKSACEAAGTRSLSDYTRSELLIRVKAESSKDRILERFIEIDEKLTELYKLTKQVFESIREHPEPLEARDRSGMAIRPPSTCARVEPTEAAVEQIKKLD